MATNKPAGRNHASKNTISSEISMKTIKYIRVVLGSIALILLILIIVRLS